MDLRRVGWRGALLVAAVLLTGALSRPAAGQVTTEVVGGAISDKTILVLEDEFAKLIKYIMDRNEATLSTGADEQVLRQIAEAARIQARTSILLIRQNNEIIRLLKKIAKER